MLEVDPNDVSGDTMEPKMEAKGPVFFLIQEQAKSIVAIKELQARLTVLESLQQRLMQAVQNVQHNLIVDKTRSSASCNYVPSSSQNPSPSKVPEEALNPHELVLKHDSLNLVPNSKSEPKGESINKDSGLGTEYKDHSGELPHHSYVNYNTLEKNDGKKSDDELLKLLDIIDQKSLQLVQQVEDVENQRKSVSEHAADGSRSPGSTANQYTESIIAQRQLCEMKADRDELKERLSKLEVATETVIREKNKLQMKLENVVHENEQLQSKIRNASNGLSSPERSSSAKTSLSDLESATMRRKYLQYSEKSRKKVACVLKETNILELQRQLLTYIMENDVLQAKLERAESAGLSSWVKVESRLKKALKSANDKISNLQKLVEERNSEIAHLENQIKEMEDVFNQEHPVKNFGLGSEEDWREPRHYVQKANVNLSPLEFGDFSKTQSLPATVRFEESTEQTSKIEKDNLMYRFNTEEFTDVSLNGTSERGSYSNPNSMEKGKVLLEFGDCKGAENSDCSTLLPSGYWNRTTLPASWSIPESGYNQSNRMKSETLPNETSKHLSAKLVNGHLCWKAGVEASANDLDSICTEFDPLSGAPSGENFVDSLNLSVPLKPNQTVSQSTIPDSLHCASLDLGCASSSVWNNNGPKLSNACSVDGLRQRFLETTVPDNFPQAQTMPNFGPNSSITSMILGRTAHPRPRNIVECMESFSDDMFL